MEAEIPRNYHHGKGITQPKAFNREDQLLTNIELQEIASHASEANNAVVTTNDISHNSSPVTNNAIDIQEQSTELTDEQQHLKEKISRYMTLYDKHGERPSISKVKIDATLRQLIDQVDVAAAHIPTHDLTELNALLYAAAKVVEDSVTSGRHHHEVKVTPPWKRRMESQIDTLRTEVNRLKAAKDKNGRLPYYMKKKYHMDCRSISEVLEDAKQRLIALSHRFKRYERRNEQFRINRMFRENPQKVFRQFKGGGWTVEELVNNKAKIHEHWKEMWEQPVTHNTEAGWLSGLETKCEAIPPQEAITICTDDLRYKLASMANWKAPGPDKVQVGWIKKFPSLHCRITAYFNMLLQGSHALPTWIVTGRTLLIRKDDNKPSTPENFRPITCLPTMWKLFTGILTRKINQHIVQNKILHHEQKGARARCRGAKDQLAIDRTITDDNRKRRTNLSMAWIDYRKAFDSLPHSWIRKCLKLYKIHDSIRDIVASSMQHCTTTLICDKEEIGNVHIKRGIFQGDSLSPLLFCLAMNPLSDILHETGRSYALKNGQKISHLLYIDDIKLDGRTENDINSLINATQIYSDDIKMKFGVKKCARLIAHRGKVVPTEGLEVEGGHIPDVSEEGYKYLGIPQHRTNMDNIAKARATAEYKKRLKKIMKSQLYAMHKIDAINAYAIPAISYTGRIVKWTVQ